MKICVKCGSGTGSVSYTIGGKPYCEDCGDAWFARDNRVWKYLVKRMMRYLGKTRKECNKLYAKYGYHTKNKI